MGHWGQPCQHPSSPEIGSWDFHESFGLSYFSALSLSFDSLCPLTSDLAVPASFLGSKPGRILGGFVGWQQLGQTLGFQPWGWQLVSTLPVVCLLLQQEEMNVGGRSTNPSDLLPLTPS